MFALPLHIRLRPFPLPQGPRSQQQRAFKGDPSSADGLPCSEIDLPWEFRLLGLDLLYTIVYSELDLSR